MILKNFLNKTKTPRKKNKNPKKPPRKNKMATPIFNMKMEDYSTRSIKVSGETTRNFIQHLKDLGGKWNSGLAGGGGWIFPATKRDQLTKFMQEVSSGKIIPTGPVVIAPIVPVGSISDLVPIIPVTPVYSQKFQVISFTIPRPEINSKVRIVMSGTVKNYRVLDLNETGSGVSKTVQSFDVVSEETQGVASSSVYKLVPLNGAWKIWGSDLEHTVIIE